VAQGTFYLYFKNKEELFKEMLLDINNESKKRCRRYWNVEPLKAVLKPW